jgi:hypothetical protein
MLQHQDVIAEIMQSPKGPEVGALFDFRCANSLS